MFHSMEITGVFRPLQDWVILAPEEKEAEGEIALPDIAKKTRYRRCRVVAVGPGHLPYDGQNACYGAHLIQTELQPGQYVFVQKFVEGEMQFSLNGETVFAIRERHLNLTINNAAEPSEPCPGTSPLSAPAKKSPTRSRSKTTSPKA